MNGEGGGVEWGGVGWDGGDMFACVVFHEGLLWLTDGCSSCSFTVLV